MEKYDVWAGHQDLAHVIENDIDRQLRSRVIAFATNDADARAEFRSNLTGEDADALHTFARRAAVLAIRSSRADRFTEGLVAVSILDSTRADYRDILWSLAFLNHAGERIGADIRQAVGYAASLSDPKTSERMLGFFARPMSGKDLRTAWGYDDVITEEGAGFIGWGLLGVGKFRPRLDFKKLTLDVADLLAKDRYQPTVVSVASEVPAVWFRKRLGGLPLSTVRAAGTIHGDLRPDHHSDRQPQKLMVFLVECASAVGSMALEHVVRRSESHVSLAVRARDLFSLVIASSCVHGVAPYETPRSLTRLTLPLKTILQNARKLAGGSLNGR